MKCVVALLLLAATAAAADDRGLTSGGTTLGAGARTIRIAATDDVAAIINAAPEYTTFILSRATYHLSTNIKMKSGQTLDGNGATFSGAMNLTSGTITWRDIGGGKWEGAIPGIAANGIDGKDPTTCFSTPDWNSCKFPNDLFFLPSDGDLGEGAIAETRPKRREAAYANLNGTDEWYYNQAAGAESVRVMEDPITNKPTILMSRGPQDNGSGYIFAIRMGDFAGSFHDITVKNLTLQFFASAHHNNATIMIWNVNGAVIDNVTMRWNHSSAIACMSSNNVEVKNSTLTDNGEVGYQGCWLSDGENIHDNVFARNGWAGYSNEFSCGNIKVGGSTNFRFYSNKVLDAGMARGQEQLGCPGLWLDQNMSNWVIENNYFARNPHAAVYVEVSCNGVLRNNISKGDKWGLLIGGSHDILVEKNYVTSPTSVGIYVSEQESRLNQNFNSIGVNTCSDSSRWAGVKNVSVKHNTLVQGDGLTGYLVSTQGLFAADKVGFEDNCYDTFFSNGKAALAWSIGDWENDGTSRTPKTFAQWQAYGFDTTANSAEMHDAPGMCPGPPLTPTEDESVLSSVPLFAP